jgi:hypothetical protein
MIAKIACMEFWKGRLGFRNAVLKRFDAKDTKLAGRLGQYGRYLCEDEFFETRY